MRILLADDQKEVRSSLKMLLEHEFDSVDIAEASDLSSLIIMAKENNPDLILLDWELAYLRISDVIPALRYLCTNLKIIAMSSYPEASKSAVSAGVDAFISKGEQPEKLLDTIRKIGISL